MKKIYISVPWKDINSTRLAVQVCKKMIETGHVPVCWSVMYSGLLDFFDNKDQQIGIRLGLNLISACDELWVFGNGNSITDKEEKTAEALGVPIVRHSVLDFLYPSR